MCEEDHSIYSCTANETLSVFDQSGAPFMLILATLKRKGSFYLYMLELPYWTSCILAVAALCLPPTRFALKYAFGVMAMGIHIYLLLFIFNEIGFHSINTPYIGK